MKKVKVSDLKAKLASYLRAVKKGESITILDRNLAIAQIVPLADDAKLNIIKPSCAVKAAFVFMQSSTYKNRAERESDTSLRILLEERQK